MNSYLARTQVNKSLRGLSLYSNNIGDVGARSLVDALRQNETIALFYLASNKIGDAGATYIAEFLQDSATLKTLYLTGNHSIGLAGTAALGRALKVRV